MTKCRPYKITKNEISNIKISKPNYESDKISKAVASENFKNLSEIFLHDSKSFADLWVIYVGNSYL